MIRRRHKAPAFHSLVLPAGRNRAEIGPFSGCFGQQCLSFQFCALDGRYLGFEDGCAPAGMIARDKYVGTYEQLARTISIFSSQPGRQEMTKFFRSFVISMVVRNGDAHRKNFGVIYTNAESEVRLCPVFDVITSTA